MSFGMVILWNWIAGLVLFFPVCGIVYFVCLKKFGKDVMDRLDKDDTFDMECLWLAAIATLLWEAAFPGICYLLYREAKELHDIMHQ